MFGRAGCLLTVDPLGMGSEVRVICSSVVGEGKASVAVSMILSF